MAINIPPNKKATFSRGFFVFTGGSGGGRTRDKRIKSPSALCFTMINKP
jgi:hypothetical protein